MQHLLAIFWCWSALVKSLHVAYLKRRWHHEKCWDSYCSAQVILLRMFLSSVHLITPHGLIIHFGATEVHMLPLGSRGIEHSPNNLMMEHSNYHLYIFVGPVSMRVWTVLKKVTCFVETKMVLTFPQSLRWVDYRGEGSLFLLVSPSGIKLLLKAGLLEPVGTFRFVISLFSFYNMKTPKAFNSKKTGRIKEKKKKKKRKEGEGKKRPRKWILVVAFLFMARSLRRCIETNRAHFSCSHLLISLLWLAINAEGTWDRHMIQDTWSLRHHVDDKAVTVVSGEKWSRAYPAGFLLPSCWYFLLFHIAAFSESPWTLQTTYLSCKVHGFVLHTGDLLVPLTASTTSPTWPGFLGGTVCK